MSFPVEPITITAALKSLRDIVAQIRRKNATLIDYYIYPNPVPTEILAYDPRLAILNTRILSLANLYYPNLEYIIDQAPVLAAAYANDIIDQLLNAIHGFSETFELRYDRGLKEKKPYDTVYKLLEHRETQLKELMATSRHLPLPESISPSAAPYFCKGAVQLINGRDHGRISFVDRADFLEENRATLAKLGGAFLWWECPTCDFRLRFHVLSSSTSTIHNNEQVKEHVGIPLEYHSIFLAKSHLNSTATQAISPISRRRSSGGARYGCIFCFAEGEELSFEDGTIFMTGRELAAHMVDEHRARMPPSLMTVKMRVAVEGKTAFGVVRWDLNFK